MVSVSREIVRRAAFSPCRTYRYTLTRVWDESLPVCVFVLLNPSTATEKVDDPTNKRGMGFATDWNCGTCVFVNLFAFRSPHPSVMKQADDPVGPMNDVYIRHWAQRADIIVAAWGTDGTFRGRDREVVPILQGAADTVWCLGTTKAGHPKHPLYLKADTELEIYDG